MGVAHRQSLAEGAPNLTRGSQDVPPTAIAPADAPVAAPAKGMLSEPQLCGEGAGRLERQLEACTGYNGGDADYQPPAPPGPAAPPHAATSSPQSPLRDTTTAAAAPISPAVATQLARFEDASVTASSASFRLVLSDQNAMSAADESGHGEVLRSLIDSACHPPLLPLALQVVTSRAGPAASAPQLTLADASYPPYA